MDSVDLQVLKTTSTWLAEGHRVVLPTVTQTWGRRPGPPCGGKLEIVLEPVQDRATIDGVLTRIDRHELVARRLDMTTGTVVLTSASRNDMLSFDGRYLVTVHG